MKTWRIHLGWAIITALGVAISARVASRPAPGDAPGRDRVSSLPERKPSSPDPEARKTTAAAIGNGESVSGPAVPQSEDAIANRIRRMILNSDQWEELQKLAESAADRPLCLLLMKEALFHKNLQTCYAGIHILGRLKGRDVAEILESYLKANVDKDQACNVAAALAEVHDPGSMPVLIDALQSRNPQVRLWSAEALHELGYSAPAEEFIASMARQYESSDGGLRKKAIEAVSQFNLGSVVPILTLGLKDSNSDVRREAITGFYNLRKPEYIPLLQAMANDPNPEVATQAQETVEALKNP